MSGHCNNHKDLKFKHDDNWSKYSGVIERIRAALQYAVADESPINQ